MIEWGRYDLIKNNTFRNTTTGLWLDESLPNNIVNNIFEYNGMAVEHFCGVYCKVFPANISNNLFINNTKDIAFMNIQSPNNFIDDRVFNNTIINQLKNTSHQVVATYTEGDKTIYPNFSRTTLNGKPIYYLANVQGTPSNPLVYSGDMGLFYCTNCSNIQLNNVNINEYNDYGIIIYYSENINITGNISNHNYGIYIKNSRNINFVGKFSNNNFNIKSFYAENSMCNGEAC
jgi:hypothetical protein